MVALGFGITMWLASVAADSNEAQAIRADCQTVPVLLSEPVTVEAYLLERYWTEQRTLVTEPDNGVQVPTDVPWDSYTVRIDFLIDSLGCSFEHHVAQSSGFDAVDRVVMESVRRVRYVPTPENEQSVPVRTAVYRIFNTFPPAFGEWHGQFGDMPFELDKVSFSLSPRRDSEDCELFLGASSAAPLRNDIGSLVVTLTVPCLPPEALLGRRFETAVSGVSHSVTLAADYVGTENEGSWTTQWASPVDELPTLDISIEAYEAGYLSGHVSAVLKLVRLRDKWRPPPRLMTVRGEFRARVFDSTATKQPGNSVD